MDLLPTCQQECLLLDYDAHGTADLAAAHAVCPDQLRDAPNPAHVYLGLAVTEDVDMRWLVIVGEDDHTQAMSTQHGDDRIG
jgi:hypothetical protein